MSNWNESPDWNLLSTINNGKEFSAADGLLASDVVRIVENVVYVYNQQNELQGTVSTIDSRLYAVQANIGSLSELTTENKSSIVASINEVNENQTATRNSLADLKEALYGYILDTTEIETESAIPYTVEVGGTTYNLVDDVRGLVKEIKGGTAKSENLLPYPYRDTTKTSKGITYTDNGDGSITVNGTATNNSAFYLFESTTSLMGLKAGSTYTISMEGSTASCYLVVNYYSGGSWHSGQFDSFHPDFFTKTIPSTWEGLQCYILVPLDATVNNVVFKPILNEGATALPYEPYFEGLKSVEYTGLEVKGKNLFDIPLTLGYPSNTNISNTTPRTFTIGTYIAGITTNNYYIKSKITNVNISKSNISFKVLETDGYGIGIPMLLPVGNTYTISCKADNNFHPGIGVSYYKEDGTQISYIKNETITNNPIKSFTVPENTYYTLISFYGRKNNEYTFSNIQLEKGSTATDYKPYLEQTILPFTTTLRGVNTYKDRIIITKNESDDYYTATKISNLISYNFTGEEAGWNFVDWGATYKRGFIVLEQYCDNVGICDKYDWTAPGHPGMWIHETATNQLNILQPNDYWTNAGVTDIATFKTYLKSIGGFNVVVALSTPTTEVLSTTLTEGDVMPLLELGGSIEIINENSLYVTGSTALEMVYKLINNTTTTSEVTE